MEHLSEFDDAESLVLEMLWKSSKKHDLSKEDLVQDLFENDFYSFATVLLHLHEALHLSPAYSPLTEFQMFLTVSDVIDYFSIQQAA